MIAGTPYELKYTLDGTDPAGSSSAIVYSKPFAVTINATIRAVGLDPATAVVRFAESQSVVIIRPLSPAMVAAAATGMRTMTNFVFKTMDLPLKLMNFGRKRWVGRHPSTDQ